MRLLALTYFRPDREHQPGGVHRTVAGLLPALADRGIDVTVACPRHGPPGATDPPPGAGLLPVLEVGDGAPPTPARLRSDAREFRAAARGADVVWSIDRPLPTPVGVPWVLTVGTISYPYPLTALRSVGWDALVVPSPFLHRISAAIAGPELWDGPPPPLVEIPGFVDVDPPAADPAGLSARLGLAAGRRYVAFPHRPDPGKGFDVAALTLCELARADERFALLVPHDRHSDGAGHYAAFRAQVRRLGLLDQVVLHEWLRSSDVASYYSLAECSLHLSRLPEGFGLTPLESVAYGTPAVSTAPGALGELLPEEHGVGYVPRDDPGATAAAVLAGTTPEALARGCARIDASYSLEWAADAYRELFSRVRKNAATYAPLRPRRAAPPSSPWRPAGRLQGPEGLGGDPVPGEGRRIADHRPRPRTAAADHL